jgi:hypothetical protein
MTKEKLMKSKMRITLKNIICTSIIGFSFAINAQNKTLKIETFNVFKDKNYKVTFEYFEPLEDSTEEHIGTLKLVYKNKKVFLRKKVTFYQPTIELEDMNNDGVKDIMILFNSSARSNWAHHLYLVDDKNKKLILVKGFEEVLNPILNENNIITSLVLTGINYYKFYRINKQNKLINLGNSFEDDGQKDNNKYDNAIKNILKQKK